MTKIYILHPNERQDSTTSQDLTLERVFALISKILLYLTAAEKAAFASNCEVFTRFFAFERYHIARYLRLLRIRVRTIERRKIRQYEWE